MYHVSIVFGHFFFTGGGGEFMEAGEFGIIGFVVNDMIVVDLVIIIVAVIILIVIIVVVIMAASLFESIQLLTKKVVCGGRIVMSSRKQATVVRMTVMMSVNEK